MNVEIDNCEINIETGSFVFYGDNKFLNSKFIFSGPAENIRQLLSNLKSD
jgi:phage pi2 protein 07